MFPVPLTTAEIRLLVRGLAAADDSAGRLATFKTLVARLADGRGRPGVRHLLAVVRLLEREPGLRTRVQAAADALLDASDLAAVLAYGGMPHGGALTAELLRRMLDRFLPQPPEWGEANSLLGGMQLSAEDLVQLRRLHPEVIGRLLGHLGPALQGRLAAARGLAMRTLAARAVAIATQESVRRAMPAAHPGRLHQPVAEVAVLALPILVDRALAEAPARAELQASLAAARRQVDDLLTSETTGRHGVSMTQVYQLEQLAAILQRLQVLAATVGTGAGPAVAALFAELGAGGVRKGELSDVLSRPLRKLHAQVVLVAGDTGEHYIARSPREYLRIILASVGGGLLTTLTAAGKVGIGLLPLAPMSLGLLSGLNYAASFLGLQYGHLMLATKQPAMTAAALSRVIRDRRGLPQAAAITDEIARLCRSQLASAAANIVAVSCGAFLFNLLWLAATGRHFMSADKAKAALTSLSAIDSLTVLYAAETGVILWLSSVLGGTFGNAVRWHAIPQRLRARGGRFIALGRHVETHAAGWGTNVALGMMLGMAPEIGAFLGLPIDVRHVTLSSGMLALAFTADASGSLRLLLGALGGIAAMFVFNLSVSFALSLSLALRTYDLKLAEHGHLLHTLLRRLLRAPWQFVLPVGLAAPPAGRDHG